MGQPTSLNNIAIPPKLTPEQYEQICKMFEQNKSNGGGAAAANSVNLAGNSSALLVTNETPEWIIDTGATNHMASDVDLLNKITIIKNEHPKKVFLPNGDISHVTHTGTSNISNTRHKSVVVEVLNKCSICLSARQTRLPFPNSTSVTVPFELIHMDLVQAENSYAHLSRQKHRHILEITRVVRFQGNIPLKFWGHYVKAATYLINRMPSIVIGNISPYEKLHSWKPSLIHLRVLGCLCHAKIVQETDKLMPRTKQQHQDDQPQANKEVQPPAHPQNDAIIQQQQPVTNDTRKSSRGKHLPKWMKDFVSLNVHNSVPYALVNYISYDDMHPTYQSDIATFSNIVEPATYAKVVKDPKWIEAMQAEITALENNKTREVFTLPKDKKPIGYKWIYKNNLGNSKSTGTSIKWMWTMLSFKVTFMMIFIWTFHKYFKAKGRQGLKQAPRQWNAKLCEALFNNKFHQSQYDHSLFTKKIEQGIITVVVYVDDMLVTGDNLEQILETKSALHKAFKMKDLGELKYFLGIEFAKANEDIVMHQNKYALELILETGLSAAKLAITPMDTTIKLTTKEYDEHCKHSTEQGNEYTDQNDEELADIGAYQRVIGKLLYLTVTRPDISYSVQKLSQFLQHPK
ncbi:uncharacterized protein LOC132631316 [Lycium barbarum]|uniref:uncharacterized protein LOC132631316 n=1 Tax=Lycium barbarum TaxID=112863 RepID=UPI00293E014E|nr:uncharacterized protein LOC132631316 [Lycium barbarum]